MPTIDILGVSHSYELTLPSPLSSSHVLVFVHGWLLSRKYWQPLINRLTPHYQCLIYDLRGFGDSENQSSNSEYTLAAYAQDLSILLEKLNIEKAWLIGHSLGGSIALWGASFCPEKVSGVICLNSGGGIYLKEDFERFRSVGQQLVKMRSSWLSYFPLIDWLFSRTMVSRPLEISWGHQRVIDYLKANSEAALGSLLDTTTETEVHMLPRLVSLLEQPVYFLAGAKDKVMESKYVRHLASFHQLFDSNGKNVIEIPDCGHLSMLEQPEIVTSHIISILKQHQALNLQKPNTLPIVESRT